MPSMHLQDIKDTMLLCDIAKKVIVEVMSRNVEKGEPGRWRKQPTSIHIEHAEFHISGDDYGPPVYEKEDIEHALVRLTMALIKLEEESEQQKHN